MPLPMNTNEQLQADFRRDGYVHLPGFLTPAQIEEVNQRIDHLISEGVPRLPADVAFYEDRTDATSLKQIQMLFKLDPFFEQMMFGSRFEALASMLLSDEVVGKNMQYFNKPPLIGQPTPAHQDGYYFMLNPCEALTMWLALEPVDTENGCIRYVRGSHNREMRPHAQTNVLGFSQGMTDFGTDEDLQNEVFFSAQPGDLLVHHALTVHRAGGNLSKSRSRRALGFIYYAARAQEDTARKEAYQRQLSAKLQRQTQQ